MPPARGARSAATSSGKSMPSPRGASTPRRRASRARPFRSWTRTSGPTGRTTTGSLTLVLLRPLHNMGKADDSLRSTRLVFYKEDIEVIGKSLQVFLRNANANCALLVDKDGHLVT